jgi:hypothetical protein
MKRQTRSLGTDVAARVEDSVVYRDRILVNLLATFVIALLMVTGCWVVNTLVQTGQDGQNCYNSGGNSCAAISLAPVQGICANALCVPTLVN